MIAKIEINNCIECPNNDIAKDEPNLCRAKRKMGRGRDVRKGSWYNWETQSKGIPDWCPIMKDRDYLL